MRCGVIAIACACSSGAPAQPHRAPPPHVLELAPQVIASYGVATPDFSMRVAVSTYAIEIAGDGELTIDGDIGDGITGRRIVRTLPPNVVADFMHQLATSGFDAIANTAPSCTANVPDVLTEITVKRGGVAQRVDVSQLCNPSKLAPLARFAANVLSLVEVPHRREPNGAFGGAPDARITLAPTGGVTDDAIDRVIRTRAGLYRACYMRQLAHAPGLAGTLIMRLTIGTDGQVTRATRVAGSLANADVEQCFTRNLSNLRFPAQTAPRTVSYRFALTSTEMR